MARITGGMQITLVVYDVYCTTHSVMMERELTSRTYSGPVRLKSMPPIVKAIDGRESILEQSKVYCVCMWMCDKGEGKEGGGERERDVR